MTLIVIFYIVNATILVLHEIESAFEEEWKIFHLPGGITGFLLFHIPLIPLVLWGLMEIDKTTPAGYILGLITGILGLVPFVVHRLVLKKEGKFDRPISKIIFYSNIVSGIVLACLSMMGLAGKGLP